MSTHSWTEEGGKAIQSCWNYKQAKEESKETKLEHITLIVLSVSILTIKSQSHAWHNGTTYCNDIKHFQFTGWVSPQYTYMSMWRIKGAVVALRDGWGYIYAI